MKLSFFFALKRNIKSINLKKIEVIMKFRHYNVQTQGFNLQVLKPWKIYNINDKNPNTQSVL